MNAQNAALPEDFGDNVTPNDDGACWEIWRTIMSANSRAPALTLARAFRHAVGRGWASRGYSLNEPVDGREPDGWDIVRTKTLYKELISTYPDEEAQDHAAEIWAILALAPADWQAIRGNNALRLNLRRAAQ